MERRRSWWRAPLVGLAVGAAAGTLYGAWSDVRCSRKAEDNWVCGAYTVIYGAAGAVAGAVGGALVAVGRR